ncbi:MAG: ABC transporter substrate-binding protein [Eubacteriales bacterium]|nr:ABC transporter substrate-binding protein [Eubacteriales bacterium]
MSKKLIALLLLAALVVGCALTGCKNDGDGQTTTTAPEAVVREIQKGTRVILGSTTELSGDFRWPGFGGSSAGASDQDITKLTVGYGTMEIDQSGAYQWNKTAVKSHNETENDDGTYTIDIVINEGLKFSDGSAITAKNYVASILSFSSPVSVAAGHSGMSGQAFVGYSEFRAYTGADAPEEAKKEFSGVRLLGEYEFSLTVSSDYYPYYFAYTYGAVDPDFLALVLGEGVDVKDDGNGCYLTDNFYAMTEGEDATYVKAEEIKANRYDTTKYPYSGPYTISKWDEGNSEATLLANPEFQGNFEGVKPTIETIVYRLLVQETQLDQLKKGEVDVLSAITGGNDTKAALAVVDGTNFSEVHYQRAGYGKIEFECDFGPTMFASVRQAITYALNRTEFCQTFTGGYGVVVDGPYSPDFAMWKAVKDDINLIDYSYSVANAEKALVEGGWIYNSKGEDFVPGQTGVDAVRYKKLTAEEAEACGGVNKTYASVNNTDGVTYKTVKIGDDYYMPLAINWFGTTPNDVTDLLNTMLANSKDVAGLGMVIRSTVGDFTQLLGEIYRDASYGYAGTPTFGMFNLATGWNTAVYDYAFNWSLDEAYFGYSANKLYDEYDVAFPYDITAEKLSLEDAMAKSGGKLGMNYLSMGMVYNAKTEDEYNAWWEAYIERWNQLMPDIPLYSNMYYDVFNAKITGFVTSPFFGMARAIIYADVKA